MSCNNIGNNNYFLLWKKKFRTKTTKKRVFCLEKPREADPAPPEPASIQPDVNPVDGGVEPSSSGGEYVGNEMGVPTATTQSGRRTRPPAYLSDYCP